MKRKITSNAHKMPLAFASLNELLDDDLKRDSKSAKWHQDDDIIDLGKSTASQSVLKPGMIPAILRKRFAVAGSNTSSS